MKTALSAFPRTITDVLLHACGNYVHILELGSPEPKTTFLYGLDGGGIGALAVHPSGRLFALCGKKNLPKDQSSGKGSQTEADQDESDAQQPGKEDENDQGAEGDPASSDDKKVGEIWCCGYYADVSHIQALEVGGYGIHNAIAVFFFLKKTYCRAKKRGKKRRWRAKKIQAPSNIALTYTSTRIQICPW